MDCPMLCTNKVCKRLERVLMDTSKREIIDRVKNFALQWATNDQFQQSCLAEAAASCLLRGPGLYN